MRDFAVGDDPEPVHPAVSHADAVRTEGFGDDHGVGVRGDLSRLGQPGDAGVSSGLLVRRPRDLERAAEPGARPPEDFRREEGGGDASLHVARAAPPDGPVANLPRERVGGPAGARGNHVEMPVQMDPPPAVRRGTPEPADDVLPGVGGGTGGTRPGGRIVVGHLETGGGEPGAEERGAVAVVLARRIDGGDADQLAAERGDFVTGGLRLAEDPRLEAGGDRMKRHRKRGYRPRRRRLPA